MPLIDCLTRYRINGGQAEPVLSVYTMLDDEAGVIIGPTEVLKSVVCIYYYAQ